MTLHTLAWLCTAGIIAHNVEEACFLPAWSSAAGRWHTPVGKHEFAFAAAVLSLLLVILAFTALSAGARSPWAYLFTGYVFAMVANAVIPHALVSLVQMRYMPGTGTALLLNVPLGVLFLWQALAQGLVESGTALWALPATALALLAAIPALFALGRALHGRAGAHGRTHGMRAHQQGSGHGGEEVT